MTALDARIPLRPEQAEPGGIRFLSEMIRIRAFEDSLPSLIERKLIRGSTHPASGLEAIAVGAMSCLDQRDAVVSTHRGHAHCLARGAEPKRMYLELFGCAGGYSGGRGGSMHIGIADLGVLGTNGIVGAGAGLAIGAGLAASLERVGSVVIVYLGDGAMNEGLVAESMNLAALWALPVIFVCEDNMYAQSTASGAMNAEKDITLRAQAAGMPSAVVDGMDPLAVREAVKPWVDRARGGGGPGFIWAKAYRFEGHNGIKDTERYRSPDEIARWRDRDPITLLARALVDTGELADDEVVAMRAEATEEMTRSAEAAARGAGASLDSAAADVYAEVVT